MYSKNEGGLEAGRGLLPLTTEAKSKYQLTTSALDTGRLCMIDTNLSVSVSTISF